MDVRIGAVFSPMRTKIGMIKVLGRQKHYLPNSFFMLIFSRLNNI